MKRRDAMEAIYTDLERCVVVTIMGAVAAELQSIGHQPNFFYLQHAMGLASSMGLGIALSRPELRTVVFDGDGNVLMNMGTRRKRSTSITTTITATSTANMDMTTDILFRQS